MQTKRFLAIIIFFVLLLSCGLMLGCTGGSKDEESLSDLAGGQADDNPGQGNAPELLIVGLDGLEPRLVQQLVERGQLKTFKSVIDRGTFAVVDCVVGTSSPVVWTTVATSTPPEVHGVTGFTVDDVPVTSTLRREPAFWNIFSRLKIPAATVGWMVSWPAEEDAGIIISDRAHWGKFQDKVSPPGILDLTKYHHSGVKSTPQFLKRFTDYPFDPDYNRLPADHPDRDAQEMIHKRLIEIYIRDTAYTEIAEDVARNHKPEVLAVYIQGADYVGHGFWQWYEPEPFRKAGWEVDPREVELLGEVIPRYYGYLDRLLAKLLRLTDEDTTVILLSDHGFQAGIGRFAPQAPYLSGNHRFEATLIMAGPNVVKVPNQTGKITHFEILPTMLYSIGAPLARDFYGRPLLEYFSNDFLAERPVQYVESYDSLVRGEDHDVKESAHDEAILEELRSLGYIQ